MCGLVNWVFGPFISMPSELLTEREGAALLLTISDPATRNTLSAQVLSAGIEALGVAESDEQVAAVILRGSGAHFLRRRQRAGLAERREAGRAAQKQMLEHLHQLVEALRVFPKPIIAAVEGAAAGAGFALAMNCDLIVAADDATFTMSYGRLGLSPDAGATWNLVQSLPRPMAQRLIWLAEPIKAPELHAMGIVGWLAPSGQSSAEALRLAGRLAAMAPNALASAKELVQQAASRTIHQQLAAERDHFIDNLFHANGAEGLQAFFEKARAAFSLRRRAPRAVLSRQRLRHEQLASYNARTLEHRDGSWFAKLSPPLQEAILSRAWCAASAMVRCCRRAGAPADDWCGVAMGAVRVSSVSLSGKQITLTYVEPGTWFGDISPVRRPAANPRCARAWRHDAAGDPQGRLPRAAVAACRAVRRAASPQLPAPAPAVRRGRGPKHPAARVTPREADPALGPKLRHCARRRDPDRAAARTGGSCATLGASRQRVNQELKAFERDGAVRIEPTRLVVLSRPKLLAIADR
jgi:enoyl-CoA hydratase/carnithine racemase